MFVRRCDVVVCGFVTSLQEKAKQRKIIHEGNHLLMAKSFINKTWAVHHNCLGSSACQHRTIRDRRISCPEKSKLEAEVSHQCQLQSTQAELKVTDARS